MPVKESKRLFGSFNEILKKTDIVIEDVTLPKLNKIGDEWEKFIKGKPINKDIVPRLIFESWERSMDYGVDPNLYNREELSLEEIENELKNSKNLTKQFGDIMLALQRMAVKKNLNIQLFNKDARNLHVLASNYQRQKSNVRNLYPVPSNASESYVGTNAINIALRENKAVQVSGPEHFNRYLHKTYCSAAPIHNSKGEIIGALNISGTNFKHNKIDTLLFVSFLAMLFDNLSFTEKALDKLDVYDLAIKNIIEYLPRGIVSVSGNDSINWYNSRIVDMLGVNKANITPELLKYVSTFLADGNNQCVENKEIFLDIRGSKKSFLLSINNLIDGNSNDEKIILLQTPDQKAQGNQAIYTFDDIIGNNEDLKKAKDMARVVAKSDSSVLIFGESGTGKELFAQAIHNASPRKGKPFVAINCGAIPHDLVESELFGYEPGAFTGASTKGKIGKMEIASGGTLFLDEIESMPLNIQIKLLRALSTNTICRVGGVKEIPIDIRIISATKVDLLQEADKGKFRDDLYYRIGIITLNLPPLRERNDDIPILAKHFIDAYSSQNLQIEDEFFVALSYYYWRGNIRELRNVIERAIVLLDGQQKLSLAQLPEKIVKAYTYKRMKGKLSFIKDKKDCNNLMKLGEEIIIETVLIEENGNLSRTAERLGISRPTLTSKINASEELRNKFSKLKNLEQSS
jgi:transcriptional regulator with PAS, ATPase and Fis domain